MTLPGSKSIAAVVSALLEANDGWAFVVDRSGGILDLNSRAAGTFFPDADSTATSVIDLFPVSQRDAARVALAQAFASRAPQSFKADRNGRRLQCRIVPVAEASGGEAAVVVLREPMTATADVVAAKEAFLADLNRGLREPLNALAGLAESPSADLLAIARLASQTLEIVDCAFQPMAVEAVLAKQSDEYRAFVEVSSDFVCVSRDGRVVMINAAGAGILRAPSADALVGRSMTELAHPDYREVLAADCAELIGEPARIPVKFRALNGMDVELEIIARPILYAGRQSVLVLGRDVTGINAAMKALASREERLRAIMNTVADGIITFSGDGIVETANIAAERIFGFEAGELVGRSIEALLQIGGAPNPAESPVRPGGIADRREIGEMMGRRKDGTLFPIYATMAELKVGTRRLFTGVVRDLTEHKELTDRISYLAQYDPLTGLGNRSLVLDRLAQAMAFAEKEGRSVAAVIIDLDKFTTINDSLGHKAGDQLLRITASRLRACVGPTDTVARVAADEFVVILADLKDMQRITAAVEAIRNAVSQPTVIDGNDVRVTCSIGISVFPRDTTNAEDLIRNAGTALRARHIAKPGSFRFFDGAMTRTVTERMALERELRYALDVGQFELFLQPQIDLWSGRLCGAEALIRWRHPRKGIVPPSRFIPFAEEVGLIHPIGDWVLRTACRQMREWRENGAPPIRMGVNISAQQVRSGDLVGAVSDILQSTGIEPSLLDLEVTESLLIEDADGMLDTLRRLKDLGVRISVDDFGTGYSALAYLKRFPIDTIKIDRTFIEDLERDSSDRAIIDAVLSMAHNLGLHTIAEGVETIEQSQILRTAGCDEIQGFLIAEPMPMREFDVNRMVNWAVA